MYLFTNLFKYFYDFLLLAYLYYNRILLIMLLKNMHLIEMI